jgi:hypothetical protein
MDKIKFLFYGTLGGVTYAFISFFLLTQSMSHHPEVLAGWAIEGFLFALFFLLLRIPFPKYAGSLKFNTANGMASGLLSSIFFVAFTYYNAVIRPERANMLVMYKASIVTQLEYQLLGFMLLGAIAGIVISLVKNNS